MQDGDGVHVEIVLEALSLPAHLPGTRDRGGEARSEAMVGQYQPLNRLLIVNEAKSKDSGCPVQCILSNFI